MIRLGGMSLQTPPKPSVLDLSLLEFESAVLALGLPRYLASQVFDWIFKKSKVSFDLMTNISPKNREILGETFDIMTFKQKTKVTSEDNTAKKYAFQLSDGSLIESVVLREKGYNTLCVSSQSGCPVNCKFCLTGVAGFKRNLRASEIVEQVLFANADGEPISHLVFMGMGEPLLNVDQVFRAIGHLTNPDCLGLSKRHITVSTSGILAGLQKLLDRKLYVNLAFSVGAAIPDRRVALMPIERSNPLMEVVSLISAYQKCHNRKLTLEYTLIQSKNDRDDDISELISLAKFLRAKINLINLNPHAKIPLDPVSVPSLLKIRDTIKAANVPVTIRFRKGQDIAAACGQLGESILEAAKG